MWYKWSDIESFNVWHDAACIELGIPHANYNVATGELDSEAQWTTAYTNSVAVADGVCAVVDAEIAELISDNLGVPCDPPSAPDQPD